MADVIGHRKDLQKTTPMMEQYLQVKEQYSDYILMYRLGDFYECFFDDALIASKELELTLTSRDCGFGNRGAMCGVPFHKADVYVGRLVEKGFKVAICEQVENPKDKTDRSLVKREVVRVVTPGTITDGSLLNEGKNNFLVSIAKGQAGIGVSFVDVSTGEVSATMLVGKDAELKLLNELSAYQPSEAIINVKAEEMPLIKEYFSKIGSSVSDGEKRLFDYTKTREAVKSVFLDESDRLNTPELIMAAGAVLFYIRETQKSDVAFVREINVYSDGQYLDIDQASRRNLELTESMRTKEKRGSLLWVLDKTETAMGARLLRSWVLKPLLNPVIIAQRQNAVSDLVNNPRERETLSELLSVMLDIERLTAKAVYGTANARDLRAIYQSIEKLPELKSLISQFKSNYLRQIYEKLDTLDDISELLSKAIVDAPPLTVREGGMIREGYSEELDYYRSIKYGGRDIMAQIEEREREETGIKTLKVDYNKVFGYYIEVTKMYYDQVPERYIRKQTLTNCERFITQELKEMENTILGAEDKIVALEFEIFTMIRAYIVENCERLRETASQIAEIDAYYSLAVVAQKNGYVCPDVDLSDTVSIKDGRHPVVEKFVTDSYFVPNDTLLDNTQNRVMIITGPNMAGKSTYMRQVAIITIMAQIGSFVPARSARIGIVDKVFTRVGASDDLASGQSTFMLEMNEVASILKNATPRSLIIYDEVGRGTSTYDGMAIARSVIEYTYSKKLGAKTLFATHYHELTDMEDEFPGIVNYNIAAKKRGDSVIFLRKIVRGGTDDSYGIEVAKLAGVPNEVVNRAKEILKDIENSAPIRKDAPKKAENDAIDMLTALAMSKESEACDTIRRLDLNTITPIEAMNVLFELKKNLKD
jgi:DNA mismatch repair protein MutS